MKRSTTTTLGVAIALALSAVLLPGAATAAERDIPVQPGGRLELDLETGGDVVIVGWDQDVVRIVSEATGRDRDEQTIDIEPTSNGVRVDTYMTVKRRSSSAGYDLDIRVPRRFDIELDSVGGAIEIRDVEGTLKGETMGGRIELEGLKGHVDMSTMGGGIRLSNSEVDGKVETMGGNVSIENVVGDVDGSSMGGNVTLENVRRPDGSSSGKTVVISTMGGDVKVANAASGARLSTMGGDIEIGSAAVFVEAETMGGDIDIAEVDGRVDAETMGGDIDVRVVGDPQADDRAIDLESMGGDVTLVVPNGFSMTVDIEIELSERKRDRYEIESDEVLEIGDRASDGRHGRELRIVRSGTGSFNGGKNRVRIRTVNGNVTLRYGG